MLNDTKSVEAKTKKNENGEVDKIRSNIDNRLNFLAEKFSANLADDAALQSKFDKLKDKFERATKRSKKVSEEKWQKLNKAVLEFSLVLPKKASTKTVEKKPRSALKGKRQEKAAKKVEEKRLKGV